MLHFLFSDLFLVCVRKVFKLGFSIEPLNLSMDSEVFDVLVHLHGIFLHLSYIGLSLLKAIGNLRIEGKPKILLPLFIVLVEERLLSF